MVAQTTPFTENLGRHHSNPERRLMPVGGAIGENVEHLAPECLELRRQDEAPVAVRRIPFCAQQCHRTGRIEGNHLGQRSPKRC